ncbi:hypothetical protein [Demequina phytophila]|uniref:hypothetical protein n=1 Tax=Demequina phytophila TaxID=1638981 RepID=UPI00146FE8C4
MASDWDDFILDFVDALGREEFTTRDFRRNLGVFMERFPDNTTPEESIRRRLQHLRDRGMIEFVDNKGTYRRVRADGAAGAMGVHAPTAEPRRRSVGRSSTRADAVCPQCFTTLAANGACGNCD